jgi:cytochrome P450
VTPDELHVEDSDYWEQLYSQTAQYDKYEWTAGRFGNNSSVFTTSNHELHRIRRAALSPLFSKRSILNFQPVILQKVEVLCKTFAAYKDNGQAFDINKAWSAFAGDVICEYAFGFGYNHLESPDFKTSFHAAFMAMGEFGHVALQFPWINPVSSSFTILDKSLNRQLLNFINSPSAVIECDA